MKVVTLESEARQVRGTSGARAVRRAEKVPAIVYGEGREAEAIALPHHEFKMALEHGARVIDLKRTEGVERVLLAEVQYDALGVRVLHADFLRMDPEHPIALNIPIELEGAPKGLADGGVLTVLKDTLHVRCLPRDIPEKLTLDVSGLGLNESLEAGKIALPEGVTLAEDTHGTIVTVAVPRAAKVAEAAAPAEGAAAAEGAPAAGAGAAPAAAGAAGAAPAAGTTPPAGAGDKDKKKGGK